MKNSLTQERLKEVLHYDELTGLFTWKVNRGPARFGCQAHNINKNGYVRIGIDRRLYYGHRLAWLYMTGKWPKYEIDHKNGIESNNRWCNLREATHDQNMKNKGKHIPNKVGVKGVCMNGKYIQARIRINGKLKHLGYFQTVDLAKEAYDSAAQTYFGTFARDR